MMKNIRFHTIAVLFAKLPTPKDNRCLHVDMRFSTFDIGSHVISCFREFVIRAEHCELHNNNGVSHLQGGICDEKQREINIKYP